MCNAWNHPLSCTCGWGGEGHTGRRNAFAGFDSWVPPLQPSYESFTKPNASCPLCGESVFFYQSPEGGRVFFDDLGPPWPKHPCTNNSSLPGQLQGAKGDFHQKGCWEAEGWFPIQLRFEAEVDKFFSRLHGIWRDSEIELYLRKSSLFKLGRRVKIQARSLAHLRELRVGTYELSMLDASARILDARCYGSLALARDSEPAPLRRNRKGKKR